MVQYTLKKATEADVPDIHRLIVDLAIYEKEPDAVTATHESLRETLFEHKYAEVVMARTEEGEAVGMALYFFNYSTWQGAPGLYLEDLFVSEAHRGHGLGKRLFGELGRIAQERKCGRVEWKVLKWNQPSIDFYVHCLKSVPQSEWEWMRVEGDEGIARLAAMRQE